MSTWSALLVPPLLVLGAILATTASAAVRERAAGRPLRLGYAARAPLDRIGWLTRQQVVTTEHPDAVTRLLAPAAYLALAAVALAVVPWGPGVGVLHPRTGIVVFGAAEALAIVAVFLRGWSPNSAFPLMAGYGFVAVALSYELLSMFVLIAAALPAESLSIDAIVASQHDLWNVVRQPLGLPLWLVVSYGVTFTGPLAVLDSPALAGGASAESSGLLRLSWVVGRHAMLAVFAAAGAAVLLGGWQGPILPGPVWMGVKTLALLGLLVWLGERLAPWPPERFVPLAWGLLLPLSFVHLLLSGLVAL